MGGGDLSMSEKCIVCMCMVVLAHWSFFCLFVCVCMVGFASQYSFFSAAITVSIVILKILISRKVLSAVGHCIHAHNRYNCD